MHIEPILTFCRTREVGEWGNRRTKIQDWATDTILPPLHPKHGNGGEDYMPTGDLPFSPDTSPFSLCYFNCHLLDWPQFLVIIPYYCSGSDFCICSYVRFLLSPVPMYTKKERKMLNLHIHRYPPGVACFPVVKMFRGNKWFGSHSAIVRKKKKTI